MALAANITLSIEGVNEKSTGIERASSAIAVNLSRGFVADSGAGAASVFYSARRTLASGAAESLDLNGSALADIFGVPLALSKIKGLIIQAADANTTNLTIGNFTNGLATIIGAATQSLVLQPGELFAKVTGSAGGYAVTADTADLLRVANGSGNNASYDIIIIGA